MSPSWRTSINQINPYIPGKSIEDVKNEYHLEKVIRLASNENQFGASPKAIAAAESSLKHCSFYPDSTAKTLRDILAKFHGVFPEEVITANGADEILSLIISAYINEGDEVIYCNPTFSSYRINSLLMGGVPVEVPMLPDWRYNLEGILDSITTKTKMIFICNPNNPTSTIVSREELLSFLDEVPDYVQVVMDEAYIEYTDKQEAVLTGINFLKQNYPVMTVRTFSKYYGLAGLRMGYVIAKESSLEPILRIRPPFANSAPAIEAAKQALLDQEYSEKHLKEIEDGKHYLIKELTKLGYDVTPSHTNFLFVHLKEQVIGLFEKLLEKGFIIRPCSPWGLEEYARITVGTEEQNISFIQALQSLNR